MPSHRTELVESLKAIARRSPTLMAALEAARSVNLESWCIGAGAVRNLVWDHLHQIDPPTPPDEIDLVYFDAAADPQQDRAIQERLNDAHPRFTWDVTNQAHVHRWYEQVFGTRVSPVYSLEDGVSTWPEYATCVGLFLRPHGPGGEPEVIAPHGLDDLFALRVRHNPVRAGVEVFNARYSGKRWLTRWPNLQLVR